jgi:glycosyltransferase involved in cell wall biosynthesis
MIELAQGPELRATCSEAARARASTFTIERYGRAIAEVYEHRLDRQGSAR